MPWCETCSKFYNPNSVAPDGTCVKCGSFIADTMPGRSAVGEGEEGEEAKPEKVPWHFWLLLVALAIYLGYRLIQGIVWLSGKL